MENKVLKICALLAVILWQRSTPMLENPRVLQQEGDAAACCSLDLLYACEAAEYVLNGCAREVSPDDAQSRRDDFFETCALSEAYGDNGTYQVDGSIEHHQANLNSDYDETNYLEEGFIFHDQQAVQDVLSQNEKKGDKEPLFLCVVCGNVTKTSEALMAHVFVQHVEVFCICMIPNCKEWFRCCQALCVHLENKHPCAWQQANNAAQKTKTGKMRRMLKGIFYKDGYACRECTKIFKGKNDALDHVQSRHKHFT